LHAFVRKEFPERPGALRKFLSGLREQGGHWNISLFHYRNHGAGGGVIASGPVARTDAPLTVRRFLNADLGKVLAGIQVPPEDSVQFSEFLDKLGYAYVEETENEIYRRFLIRE
jgi:threonine dehydratase